MTPDTPEIGKPDPGAPAKRIEGVESTADQAEAVFTNGSELAAQTQQRIDTARDLIRRLDKGALLDE